MTFSALAAEPLPELKAAYDRLSVPLDLHAARMTPDLQEDLVLQLRLATKDAWPDSSTLNDAVEVLEKGAGADHPLTALFRARVASLRDQESGPGYPRKDSHEAVLQRSLRALAALPPAHPARVEVTAHLARYLLARFRMADAERLLAPLQASASPQAAAAIADLRHLQARYADAEKARQRALERAGSPTEAVRLRIGLAGDLLAQGKSGEAGRILQEALDALQPDLALQLFLHSDVLEGLGEVATYEGRLQDANAFHQRAHGLLEGKVTSNHPRVAIKLMKSISASAAAGEPENVWGRKVPMIHSDAPVTDSVSLAATAWEANHPRRVSAPEDRRPYLDKHLAFAQRALGAAHPVVAASLMAQAEIAHDAGRDNEAEPLARRALTIRAAALGPRHLHTLETTELLAQVLEKQGRAQDSEILVRQVAAEAGSLPETQPLRWRLRARTARLLDQQGLHAKAAAEWRPIVGWLRSDAPVRAADRLLWTTQALESELATGTCPGDELAGLVLANHRRHGGSDWGSSTPDLLRAAANYAHAEVLACKGDRDGAVRAFRAMESNLILVADSHPQKLLYRARRVLRLSENEATAREASGSYGNYNATLLAGVRERRTLYAGSRHDQLVAARSATGPADQDGLDVAFQAYLNSAWKALKPQLDSWGPAGTTSADIMRDTLYVPVRDEAFVVAQELHASTAAQALAEAAARARYNDPRLDTLVKQRKELADRAVVLDRRLLAVAAAGAGKEQATALEAQLRAAIAALAPVNRDIATQFPEYAALTDPKPLAATSVRESLKEGEGVLLIVPSGKDVHVFALTRDEVVWHSRADGAAYADSRIRRLRCQVDASTCAAAPAPGNGEPAEPSRGAVLAGGQPSGSQPSSASSGFDVQAAHELYREFLGPVAPALAKVRSLMVATAGSFSSLPPGLLVTEPPAPSKEPAWLSERFVVSVLPAVSSIVRRGPAVTAKATRYLVGFGDPAFDGNGAATRSIPPLAGLFSGRGELGARANPAELRRLARLPGTAAELKAMATAVGANRAAIRLGGEASESAVKRSTELPEAQVVVFATHGLLPRSLNSVTEPGLAFTPPGKASDLDDGLLTASEAAALRLKAEFVILSACNTASGDDRPGAESLSGLARALLHAGARSLLVSHWEVRDDATAALTVEMLRLREAQPTVGRAGALQAAMRAVRTGKRLDGSALPGWKAGWAHPAAWAPFVLIQAGE